jgi:uncharacterized protein YndB with AHSA1/START domain
VVTRTVNGPARIVFEAWTKPELFKRWWVTFDEKGGKTLLTVHNLFASKEALDDEIASGGTAALPETLDQLEELLTTLVPNAG